jgi:hypothetical protein
LLDPLRELFFTHLSGSHSFHDSHHVGLAGIDPVSIPE